MNDPRPNEQDHSAPAAGAKPAAPRPPSDTIDDLDLTVERIETEGVMKEGFTGQEM